MKKNNKMISESKEKVALKTFSFPDYGISIDAENIEEATKKLEKINPKK